MPDPASVSSTNQLQFNGEVVFGTINERHDFIDAFVDTTNVPIGLNVASEWILYAVVGTLRYPLAIARIGNERTRTKLVFEGITSQGSLAGSPPVAWNSQPIRAGSNVFELAGKPIGLGPYGSPTASFIGYSYSVDNADSLQSALVSLTGNFQTLLSLTEQFQFVDAAIDFSNIDEPVEFILLGTIAGVQYPLASNKIDGKSVNGTTRVFQSVTLVGYDTLVLQARLLSNNIVNNVNVSLSGYNDIGSTGGAATNVFLSQATWFIDPVNGDDGNDGLTALTALQTHAELERRWGAKPAMLTPPEVLLPSPHRPVIVTIMGDLPIDDPINIDVILPTDGYLGYTGIDTVLSTLVPAGTSSIAVIRTTAGGTPARLGSSGSPANWPTTFTNRRFRVNGGVNNNVQGWILDQLSPFTAFISVPVIPPLLTGVSIFTVNPTSGVVLNNDVVEIISNPIVATGYISARQNNTSVLNGSILSFNNLEIFGGGYANFGNANVTFNSCKFLDIQPSIAGSTKYCNCLFTAGADFLTDGFVAIQAGSGKAMNFGVDGFIDWDFYTWEAVGTGIIIRGSAQITGGFVGAFSSSGNGVQIGDNFEGPGLLKIRQIAAGGHRLYGSGNAGIGLNIQAAGKVIVEDIATPPTITGSGGEFRCGNTAATIITLDPATGLASGAITQTWANFIAARPAAFGGNILNLGNGATLALPFN